MEKDRRPVDAASPADESLPTAPRPPSHAVPTEYEPGDYIVDTMALLRAYLMNMDHDPGWHTARFWEGFKHELNELLAFADAVIQPPTAPPTTPAPAPPPPTKTKRQKQPVV